jgi:hypothetical protein
MKYSLRSLMIVGLVTPPLLAFLFFACQPPVLSGPEVVPVEGVVRLNGEPLAAGVSVYFAFDDGNFANGITDNGGEFFLGYVGHVGCPPKPAKVWFATTSGSRPSGVAIPARYTDHRQTPLVATPIRRNANYIALDLYSP